MNEPIIVIPKEQAAKCWSEIGGDHSFRVDYELDANSVVFDVGGYKGKWTGEILSRYGCKIHVFEPVPEFAHDIREKFTQDVQVTVHELALGQTNDKRSISIMRDSSSFYREVGESQIVEQVCAAEFIENTGLDSIDLMEVNIEGGEYDLLDHLIESGMMPRIKNIQIQFHDFIPDAYRRLVAIQDGLQQTHELAFRFLFIWEGWRLKSA